MTLLGFGDEKEIQWQYGGSLISKDFVLTAAHCTRGGGGVVKWVLMGVTFVCDWKIDPNGQLMKVAQVIRHPSYKAPQGYNEIALLKLDRPVNFTNLAKPACLQVEHSVKSDLCCEATGWGALQQHGGLTEQLQTVNVPIVTASECSKLYKRGGLKTPEGIKEELMLCAGAVGAGKDTCQGDSGGPLQFKLEPAKHHVHQVVGITSFGNGCGKIPGVYTRVSRYVTWIESIVWPKD